MANVRIGSPLTALEERPESPLVTRTTIGDKIVHRYNLTYASAKAVTDALTYGTADAVYTSSKLREMQVDKNGPKNAIVTLTYVPDEWIDVTPPESLPPVGTITYDTDSNVITLPLANNPDVTDADLDKDKNIGAPGGPLEGIEGFLSPQPIFTRTEILGSFTFSQGNIIEDVARVFTAAQMATAGMSGATDDRWLKTALRVRTVGDKFEKVEQWQYAENGWAKPPYKDAT